MPLTPVFKRKILENCRLKTLIKKELKHKVGEIGGKLTGGVSFAILIRLVTKIRNDHLVFFLGIRVIPRIMRPVIHISFSCYLQIFRINNRIQKSTLYNVSVKVLIF